MPLPMSAVFLVTATALASAVEMVEALTIILAVGLTREWRSTLVGGASALIVLAAAGAMLTTFGIFWGAEGAGAEWPGADLAILGILALVLVVALGLVALLKKRRGAAPPPPAGGGSR